MKKKGIIYFSLILFLGIFLIAAFAYKTFYYDEKQEASKNINTFLEENNYKKNVSTKEIVLDTTTGEYFARVTFKDEPNNEYEIYQTGSNHFKVIGYKDGVQITNTKEGKYIKR